MKLKVIYEDNHIIVVEKPPNIPSQGDKTEDVDMLTLIKEYLKEKYKYEPTNKDLLSYALYPDVFEDYLKFVDEYGDVSRMGSDVFFHGLAEGETCEIEVEEGRTLIVQLVEIGRHDEEGNRILVFEVNGNRREIKVKDKTRRDTGIATKADNTVMADPENKNEVGSSIPGNINKVLVNEGDEVKEGQSLIIIEAMKMETNIVAPVSGVIEFIAVKEGQQVKTGELLMKIK